MMKNKKKLIYHILIILAALIITLVGYKNRSFGTAGIDELLFYTTNGLEGANTSTFYGPMVENSIVFLIITVILFALFADYYKNKVLLLINFKTKKRTHKLEINPTKTIKKYYMIYAAILLTASLAYAAASLHVYRYVSAAISAPSTLFEDHYVDPKTAKLTFPAQKRNLIYIYLESTENTLFSDKNGGGVPNSLSPELEYLALDPSNLSFSNTDKVGGMLPVQGSTFTVGGIVAQSAGLPVLNLASFDHNGFGNFNKFLPGAYTIGDILAKEGYAQEYIIGSEASFGGRDKLFTQHGDYKIFDYNTAKQENKIAKDYHVWWGYEDKKLFEYAKEELTTISSGSKPFNFQLLTVDTHYVDGYLDETCSETHDRKYEDVYACSSAQIGNFVNWIKQQDFYENTTVVIAGDHLGMQTEFYKDIAGDDYQRTIYNVILNSAKTATSKTNRQYTSFDFYPTTLSSMGVKIKGDKLGLGVDLFSNKKTLVEEYGLDYINTELQKKSNFYYNNILIGK